MQSASSNSTVLNELKPPAVCDDRRYSAMLGGRKISSQQFIIAWTLLVFSGRAAVRPARWLSYQASEDSKREKSQDCD